MIYLPIFTTGFYSNLPVSDNDKVAIFICYKLNNKQNTAFSFTTTNYMCPVFLPVIGNYNSFSFSITDYDISENSVVAKIEDIIGIKFKTFLYLISLFSGKSFNDLKMYNDDSYNYQLYIEVLTKIANILYNTDEEKNNVSLCFIFEHYNVYKAMIDRSANIELTDKINKIYDFRESNKIKGFITDDSEYNKWNFVNMMGNIDITEKSDEVIYEALDSYEEDNEYGFLDNNNSNFCKLYKNTTLSNKEDIIDFILFDKTLSSLGGNYIIPNYSNFENKNYNLYIKLNDVYKNIITNKMNK